MNYVEKIKELEDKYSLNEKKINDYHFWTYARFKLYDFFSRSYDPKKKKDTSKIEIVRLLFSGIFINKKVKIKNIDVLFLSHPRRVFQSNKYECIYTDKIAERTPNSLTLERLWQGKNLRPVYTKNIMYCSHIQVKSYLFYIFYKIFHHSKYMKIKKEAREIIELPITELERTTEYKIVDDFVEKIAHQYFFYLSKYRSYEKLVRKLSPKKIVEVVSYDFDAMVINEIAKKWGIPTIELQHGTIGEGHLAYNYPPNSRIQSFPDYILTFSEFWSQTACFPIDKKKVVAVGFPYFERKVLECVGKCNGRDRRKTIVFISQGTIAVSLSNIALQLARILDENEWKIIYKQHPSEYQEGRMRCNLMRESNIEVIDSLNISVYECFAVSDIQIGAYSTALYEGLAFGLCTFLFDMDETYRMQMLVDKGYAKLFLDVHQLAHMLLAPTNDVNIDSKEFWETESLNKMIQFISEII